MTDICQLCDEPVLPGQQGNTSTLAAHRVCLLRSGTGGIGHLVNHAYWCLQMHDPDGGRTRYQSALEVDDWIAEHGADATFADSTDGIPHPRKDPADV